MKKTYYFIVLILTLMASTQPAKAGRWVTQYHYFNQSGELVAKQYCQSQFLTFQCQPDTYRDVPTGINAATLFGP